MSSLTVWIGIFQITNLTSEYIQKNLLIIQFLLCDKSCITLHVPMITEQLLLYLHTPAFQPKANNLSALSTGLVLKYLYAVITRRCWRYPMMAPLSRFMMPGLHHLSKYPLQIVQVVYSILYSQLRPFKSPHGNLLPTQLQYSNFFIC